MEKEYIEWNEYGNMCKLLALKINKDPRKIVGVYGIPRGGLSLSVYMSHMLNLPYIHDIWKFSDKENYLLCVDDISDTGRSLNDIMIRFKILGFKTPVFATLHCKPKSVIVPDYYCEMTNNWIIYPFESEYSEPSEYHKKVYSEMYKCDTVLCGNANQEMLDSLHGIKEEPGICEFLDSVSKKE